MATTKVSSKGQVVLPKEIREAMDWPAGTDLLVERENDRVVLRRGAPALPVTTLDDVAGSVPYDGPPLTLAEIEQAIAAGLAERWERKRR